MSQTLVKDDRDSSFIAPDTAWKQKFRRRLLSWFKRSARDLPWRRTRDLYQIWISEIMLQQTQVSTVEPYFDRFIAAMPNVAALARASEEQVFRLWEGLGYYRRARQLHKAARIIAEEQSGKFPRDLEKVLSLPGVGRYTAGAILSIALDQPHPILEANTIRVLSRLLAYRGDTTRSKGQQLLWRYAEELLPSKNAGAFNQAMMELGSEICTPQRPNCQACPASELCPTHRDKLYHLIPAPKKKTAFEDIREAAIIVRRRGKVLLRRCEPQERWAGLWDFPRFAIEAQGEKKLQRELAEKSTRMTGLILGGFRQLATIKHGVTRYRITLLCYNVEEVSGRLRKQQGRIEWVNPKELNDLPLSVTGRKISRRFLAPA